jgi:glycosyltransferase involved in cell wall biosynthesis
LTVVLHVLEALEGGTARHVTDLVRHVGGVTHHVAVPPRRVGGMTDSLAVPEMEAAGATVHRVGMRRMPLSPRNAAALARLRRLVVRIRPDVVHGHSAVGGALARLATADGRAGRIYTPNGLHPSIVAMNVERGLRTLTDRWIAVSPGEAAVAAVRDLAPPSRIVTIPNGIDLADGPAADGRAPVDLRHLLRLPPDAPVVGFVGRLVRQKAPEIVIEAAALLRRQRPDVRTVMIGSGSREGALRALMRERGLAGSVHLIPYLPRAALVMDQFDVLLLPSLYEGCPYTVLEAMRAGTPLVVSDAVGNRDLVIDGVTGRLVRQGHPEDTAAALMDVLGDPDGARRRAQAARAHLSAHHDVTETTAATAAVYAELA